MEEDKLIDFLWENKGNVLTKELIKQIIQLIKNERDLGKTR
jgi:hypothetical protein